MGETENKVLLAINGVMFSQNVANFEAFYLVISSSTNLFFGELAANQEQHFGYHSEAHLVQLQFHFYQLHSKKFGSNIALNNQNSHHKW